MPRMDFFYSNTCICLKTETVRHDILDHGRLLLPCHHQGRTTCNSNTSTTLKIQRNAKYVRKRASNSSTDMFIHRLNLCTCAVRWDLTVRKLELKKKTIYELFCALKSSITFSNRLIVRSKSSAIATSLSFSTCIHSIFRSSKAAC